MTVAHAMKTQTAVAVIATIATVARSVSRNFNSSLVKKTIKRNEHEDEAA
jgi:hypothetical protein